MRSTQYFLHTHERPDRHNIRLAWIERVVLSPAKERVQADGRIRRWARIPEARGRYLRAVLPEDGEAAHDFFFDYSFLRAEP